MKLKTLFILSTVTLVLLGAGLIILPGEFISIRTGQPPDTLTVHIARQFGTLALVLGIISWLVRNADRSKELNAIIAGLVTAFILLPIETAFSIINGSESAEGWVLVILFGLLALGFIILSNRKNSDLVNK